MPGEQTGEGGTLVLWGTQILSELCRGTEEEADDGSVRGLQPATSQAVPWLQVPQGVKSALKTKAK